MSNPNHLASPRPLGHRVAHWRQLLSIGLSVPSNAALLSLWLPMPAALGGGALVGVLLIGQWLLARVEGDHQRILLSSQWSLLASLLIGLAVMWWQGPMAALAAALCLGTGWAWFGQKNAFELQVTASGLSLLIALMFGQDEQLALLFIIYLPGLWLCLLSSQKTALSQQHLAARFNQHALSLWLSRLLAPFALLALGSMFFLLSPRLQGSAWLPMTGSARLQSGEGHAQASADLVSTRNRLQQQWLLTLAPDGINEPISGEFAAFGERFNLDQLGEQASSGQVLARVKSPRALNLQVSRFDYFDGTQWLNSGEQAQTIPMPPAGLHLSADRNIELTLRWLRPTSSALPVPGGWQMIKAPSEVIKLGAQSLALPQIPPTGFTYQVASHGLSLDGHTVAQRDDLLHPNYLQVPEPLMQPLQEWLSANLPPLPDAWQKAQWLERHLQTHYGANRAAVLPSYKRDPLLFYLNEQRAGRSETAASALTLLLRRLSIPARLSCGWALQQRNIFTGLFNLTAAHPHCYSEAFINNHGWVELEPSNLYAARTSSNRLSLGALEWRRTLPAASPWHKLIVALAALMLAALSGAAIWRLWVAVQHTPRFKHWQIKRLAKAPLNSDDPAAQSLAYLLKACSLAGYHFAPGSGIYPWACLWQTLLPSFDADRYCADFYHHHFGLNTQGDISTQHQMLLKHLSDLPWRSLTQWIKPQSSRQSPA